MDRVKNLTIFCLGLIPIFAVSSQSLLDLTFTILGVICAIALVKSKGKNCFRKIGIEKAFASYFIIVCLGFYFNSAPDVPWLAGLFKFVWVLNLYILICSFDNIDLHVEKALKFLAAASLLPTAFALVTYWIGTESVLSHGSRLTGLVNSPTYHAHGNAILCVSLISFMFFKWNSLSHRWKVFCGISILLLGVSIILTFTRGIWISIFVSSMIMLCFISLKRVIWVFFGSLAIVAVMAAVWPRFRERLNPNSSVASTSERVNLLKVNFQMWKEYPLLGIGLGENLRRNREYWDKPEWRLPEGYITSHAHNQYVNTLSTTGVFGLLTFLWFSGFFVFKNFRLLQIAAVNKKSPFYILLFTCLWCQIEFWLACVTDVGFEYAKIRTLIIFVWAVLISVEYKMNAASSVPEAV